MQPESQSRGYLLINGSTNVNIVPVGELPVIELKTLLSYAPVSILMMKSNKMAFVCASYLLNDNSANLRFKNKIIELGWYIHKLRM